MKKLIGIVFFIIILPILPNTRADTTADIRLGVGIDYIALPSQPSHWGLEIRGESRWIGLFLGGGGFERYVDWWTTEFRCFFPYLGIEFFPLSFPWFRGGAGLFFQPETRSKDPVFPFVTVGFYFPVGTCKNWGWFLQSRGGALWSITFGAFWRPPPDDP